MGRGTSRLTGRGPASVLHTLRRLSLGSTYVLPRSPLTHPRLNLLRMYICHSITLEV